MAQVILVNNRPETIFSPRDFEDLIDKYMGCESADLYHRQIEQLSECIKGLAEYINDKDVSDEIEGVLKVHGYE